MKRNISGILLLAAVAFAAGRDLRLVEAVRNQDKAAVQALLKQRVDVNATFDGATALHWAVHRDDRELAELLIGAGANVNAADDDGVTALSLACSNKNSALVGKLLGAGANPNAGQTSGETPLMTCSRTGSIEGVTNLLAKGAVVNAVESSRGQTALMWAVAERHPEVVKVLLAHGADVNARSTSYPQTVFTGENILPAPRDGKMIATVQRGGTTPLMFAARNGDLESAKQLVAAGAKVNDAAADGNSVLVIATHSGNRNLATFLLDKDANPNAAGAGYTALHAAVLRGDAVLVTSLLAHGANPNAQVTKGTPVTREGMDFVLPTLLVGATPFMLAAKYVESDIMRELAAHGADPKMPMKDGSTPLMAAAGIGWVVGADRRGVPVFSTIGDDDERLTLEAVRVALEAGADVNAANATGETALHGAASKGFNSVVQLLADKGAKLEAKTRRGLTPLAMTAGTPPVGSSHGVPVLVSTAALLRKLGATQ